MTNYKGTGIVYLRDQIKKSGIGKEETLINLLTVEDRSVWEKTLPMSWVPVKIASSLWGKASKVIYPELTKDDAIFQCGVIQAKEDIKGMYRLLFKVINTQTIIQKAAGMWRTFHQTGNAAVETLSATAHIFHVTGYPDLPEGICQSACGYIYGLVELAGKKNISVKKQKTPTGWDWTINYQ